MEVITCKLPSERQSEGGLLNFSHLSMVNPSPSRVPKLRRSAVSSFSVEVILPLLTTHGNQIPRGLIKKYVILVSLKACFRRMDRNSIASIGDRHMIPHDQMINPISIFKNI